MNPIETEATTSAGKIVGKGLYLELIPEGDNPNNKTTQILFTPEGFDEKGNYVPFTLHSRTVADYSPRKQWRLSKSPTDNKTLFLSSEPISAEIATSTANGMATRFESLLKRQVAYGLVVRNKPIVVEITSIDLSDVTDWKTPPAALRRIQKARVSLGFPEKLV